MDFGLANDGIGRNGTTGFSSPEQFSQTNQNNRTDCFAMGKVLIFVLFSWKVLTYYTNFLL